MIAYGIILKPNVFIQTMNPKKYILTATVALATCIFINASVSGNSLRDTLQRDTISYFKPGQFWPDNQGKYINAHGGGILFYHGKYYWFGEHKIGGHLGSR